MSNESSKLHSQRLVNGDFHRYLIGKGIDIGCGPDPVRPPNGVVRTWDLGEGDAQFLAGVADDSFDFVYSSHCLEHMVTVTEALHNWSRVLRPGGFLYLVVPDYILYEKLTWPSRFNHDHKHSFCLTTTREQVRRSTHWNIHLDLARELTELGHKILEVRREDFHFDYNLGANIDQTLGPAVAQICIVSKKSPSAPLGG